MQKERAIQKQRGAKERENDGSPGGHDPFDRKLEIEKRHDGGCAQVREEGVEMQAAVAAGIFFLLRQLRIDEEENQDEWEDRVHPRTPELAGLTRGEIGEENPGECGDERDVRLISELGDLAQQAVLEEYEAKSAPGHGDAGGLRLQLIPKEQTADGGRGPGVNVMEVSLEPHLEHADEAEERREDNGHDAGRQQEHAE